ncbi:hydroxypyruvate isomerase family protein [Paraburkholderia sp. BL25I1N1]|uniref:hydroxypyruvate isomerase family protein n=1 Tax=Paraburkholderia sp. BL25I1N1 TaxID=1938804 RepID=UPI000D06EC9A|nr:TIM barrel protein [Paraburkholderia sp. BL25I1N1]PRX97595.1 hydroxypyruvate isomerase [Paraburkholderia sp. BL25I1N1]
MRRYAANIGMLWSGLALLERIDAAARAGFRAVEMHFPYDVAPGKVRDAIERNNLTLLGINSPPGNLAAGELGLAAVPGRETDFVESMRTAFTYCRESGARSLHIMGGNTSGLSRKTCLETFRSNILRAADLAESNDIQLLLEPLNTARHPHYFYHRVDELVEILNWVRHPRLGIQFDTYHVGMETNEISTLLRRNWSMIAHIQIAAVPDRSEPNSGDIDIAEVLREAESLGYAGWIGCEYQPGGSVEEGLGWRQDTRFVETG